MKFVAMITPVPTIDGIRKGKWYVMQWTGDLDNTQVMDLDMYLEMDSILNKKKVPSLEELLGIE